MRNLATIKYFTSGSPMTANGHTTPTPTTPETTAATLAAVAAAANTMAALASSTTVYPKTEDPSRPFACGVCPKRFRMKHHLKVHFYLLVYL